MENRRRADRRRLRRVMRPIPAAYETDDIKATGQIRCLSMVGLVISCEDLPAVGDLVRVELQSLDDQRIELCGNVVSLRSREGQLSQGERGFFMRVDAGIDTYLDFYHQVLTAG
jgi:hypothetical protein